MPASGGGGVFRSTNKGVNWQAIRNGLTNADVLVLAIDPTSPSTLYASPFGDGVFRSTDGGANWQAVNHGLTDSEVSALALDPSNPSTVYAGVWRGGVFRSTNKGASWQAINSGLTDRAVLALAIDPTNPSTLYAGGGSLFKSTDRGGSWEEINNGLMNPPVRALAIDPTNTSTLYAGTTFRLLKSTDSGANWVQASPIGGSEALAIDPTNPSTLYAGAGLGGGVFMSINDGAAWELINNGLTNTSVWALAIDPTNTSTLYAGTRGGVFKTTEVGANRQLGNWTGNWVAINKGLSKAQVSALALDATNSSTLYAGTKGAGVFIMAEEPHWLYAAGNASGTETQFDGLAFTNFSDSEASLDLEAITSTAATAAQPDSPLGNLNPVSVILQSGEQTAQLRTDLFEGDPSQPAWIELTSDTSEVGTSFQFGTGTLSQLDGGVTIAQTSTNIVFTRVFDGPQAFRGQPATTRVSILNPNDDPVTMELNYRPLTNAAGSHGTSSVTRTIEGRSFLDERAADLFGMNPSLSSLPEQLSGGLITGIVTEGEGVVAFEVIQLTDQSTVLGLNAATGNSTNGAYSAQLASQPGLFTSVNVINLADAPRNVTLRAVKEDGSDQGNPVAMVLRPGEQFTEDAGLLFGTAAAGAQPAQGGSFVGSLVVEADGGGVVGDVIFGDSADFAFAASLPLQTETFTESLFNQVANVSGFFTGLAFFYPDQSQGASPQGPRPDAEITIQVFLPGGEMAGEGTVVLAPGERTSQLVEQLVGEIELAGGYVRIFSTEAVVGQMLFGVLGPGGIQLFSAVPPTVVR